MQDTDRQIGKVILDSLIKNKNRTFLLPCYLENIFFATLIEQVTESHQLNLSAVHLVNTDASVQLPLSR